MNFIDEKGFNELQSSLDGRTKSETEPSFVAGSAGALFDGVANGFTQVSSQAMAGGYDATDGASALFGMVDSDPTAAYPEPETIRQNAKWASDALRPDPQTTGTMAQILFGVGDVGSRFATGYAVGGPVGGALLSGSSVGAERYDELTDQGVDSKTALGAAAIRGITTGAGALLPGGFGSSLLSRVASGVGINVAAGAGGRAAEGTALNSYKQGDELKAFHAQDVAVDAVLGGIFGGISRLGVDVSHDQFDAALALKNAKSFNVDSMPGTPDSVGDIARHGKLMDTALDDILNDRAVSVDAEAGGVKFKPREAIDETAPDEQTGLAADDLSPYQRNTLRAAGVTDDELGSMTTSDAMDRLVGDPQQTHLLTDDTPEPPEGYTRLYRGEHQNQDRGVFETGEQDDGKVGGWFTQDRDYADSYRDTQEQGRKSQPGRVVFVDVPKSQLDRYKVAGSELGKVGIRTNEDSYFINSLRRNDVIDPQPYVPGHQSYADIIKSAFDEEGYGQVYSEMTQAESRAAQIDRSQSQFTPEDVPEVVEPSAFRDIQSESFRDLQAGDRVTPSRDIAGLRAGKEVPVRSVDEQGSVQFDGPDGQPVSVPREATNDALDVGLSIRRPVPTDKPVPTEFGETAPASTVIDAADKSIEDANTEGKAYDAAVDCFLSRGN